MVDIVTAYKNKNKLEAARFQAAHLKASEKSEKNPQASVADGNHPDRLAAARRSMRQNIKSAAKTAKKLSKIGAVASLLKEANMLLDMPFIAALGAAVLKDALDLADFATVILPMLFSSFCSIFIFMMLLLVGASGKKKMASNMIKKGLVVIGGGVFDAVPGLDLFPIETATVLVIYLMTLYERMEAREAERAEESLAFQG